MLRPPLSLQRLSVGDDGLLCRGDPEVPDRRRLPVEVRLTASVHAALKLASALPQAATQRRLAA